jgi:hypothetical protein
MNRCEATKDGARCNQLQGHEIDTRNLLYPIAPMDSQYHKAVIGLDGKPIEDWNGADPYWHLIFWLDHERDRSFGKGKYKLNESCSIEDDDEDEALWNSMAWSVPRYSRSRVDEAAKSLFGIVRARSTNEEN